MKFNLLKNTAYIAIVSCSLGVVGCATADADEMDMVYVPEPVCAEGNSADCVAIVDSETALYLPEKPVQTYAVTTSVVPVANKPVASSYYGSQGGTDLSTSEPVQEEIRAVQVKVQTPKVVEEPAPVMVAEPAPIKIETVTVETVTQEVKEIAPAVPAPVVVEESVVETVVVEPTVEPVVEEKVVETITEEVEPVVETVAEPAPVVVEETVVETVEVEPTVELAPVVEPVAEEKVEAVVETVVVESEVEPIVEEKTVEQDVELQIQTTQTTTKTVEVEQEKTTSLTVKDTSLMARVSYGEKCHDWAANMGDTLRGLLNQWGEMSGWTVIWKLDRDYQLEAGVIFRGTFTEVSSALIRSFARATPAPIGTFYKGNRVLVISTVEDENAN